VLYIPELFFVVAQQVDVYADQVWHSQEFVEHVQESCEIFLILFLYSKQELERYFGAKQVLYIVVLVPQLS